MNIEAMAPDIIVLRHDVLGGVSSAGADLQSRGSSTPAMACTSTRHRRCSMRSQSASTEAHRRAPGGCRRRPAAQPRVAFEHALLTKLGADVWLSGPPTMVPTGIQRLGVRVSTSVDEAVEDADVIMMLRIQQERMQGAFFPRSANTLRCSV